MLKPMFSDILAGDDPYHMMSPIDDNQVAQPHRTEYPKKITEFITRK